MPEQKCFICMDSGREAFRAVCINRGFHRPIGEEQEHRHPTFLAMVRVCGDCETLVVVEEVPESEARLLAGDR